QSAHGTSEQYVARWLPTDVVWLSNVETRDLFHARAHDLAVELNTTPATPGVSVIEAYLLRLADGTYAPNNEELNPSVDPFVWSKSTNAVQFFELWGADGTQVIVDTTLLPPESMQRIYQNILVPFLQAEVSGRPELYGGSTATGPSLQYNPTW